MKEITGKKEKFRCCNQFTVGILIYF